MRVTTCRSFQRQKTYAVWVERKVLHKATDHHVSWITQRNEQPCFWKKPQHSGNEHGQSRVLIKVNAIVDRFIQRRLQVVETACALGSQSLDGNRIKSLSRGQGCLCGAPHRRKDVTRKGLALIGTHEA